MIGVIGYRGRMGGFHTKALKNLRQEIYTADVRDGPLDIESVADMVDAAVIATPTELHHEHALKFLQRGKPVLIEKPIALTIEQGKDLVQTAHENNTMVSVGYLNRFIPAFEIGTQAIRSDEGDLRVLRANAAPSYNYGGVALDIGTHDIDLVRYAFGSNIDIKPIDIQPGRALYYCDGEHIKVGWLDSTYFPNGEAHHIRKWWWYGKNHRVHLDLTEQTVTIDGKVYDTPVVNQIEEQARAWIELMRTGETKTLCTGEQAVRVLEVALG